MDNLEILLLMILTLLAAIFIPIAICGLIMFCIDYPYIMLSAIAVIYLVKAVIFLLKMIDKQ